MRIWLVLRAAAPLPQAPQNQPFGLSFALQGVIWSTTDLPIPRSPSSGSLLELLGYKWYMNTAKVVRFRRLGGPEVLEIEDLPIQEPGPGEVRIKVQAIGL